MIVFSYPFFPDDRAVPCVRSLQRYPDRGMFSLITQREMCIDLLSPGVLRGCRVILMGLKEATGSS